MADSFNQRCSVCKCDHAENEINAEQRRETAASKSYHFQTNISSERFSRGRLDHDGKKHISLIPIMRYAMCNWIVKKFMDCANGVFISLVFRSRGKET